MEVGTICKINSIEYIVLAQYKKYSMLLNNANSEMNGAGNVILVEDIDGNNAKVVKDKAKIAYVVQQILKDEEDNKKDE